MNVNEAFPSNYLKAADLQGREVPVVVSHVTMEKVGNDQKMVAYFQGKQKGVIINKTNAMNIAAAFGPVTEGWAGKQVVLFSVWTDFHGKSVQALRLRPGYAQPSAPVAPPPPLAPVDPRGPDPMADEIPF
jgi:hypothetical protein